MTGGYIFTLCVSPHLERVGGGGNPPSRADPRTGQRVGTPLPPPPHPGQIPGWGRGSLPGQIPGQGRGYPPSRSHRRTWGGQGGYPPPHLPVPSRLDPRMGGTLYWNSIACACYEACGVPLAITQEDFLVGSVNAPLRSTRQQILFNLNCKMFSTPSHNVPQVQPVYRRPSPHHH